MSISATELSRIESLLTAPVAISVLVTALGTIWAVSTLLSATSPEQVTVPSDPMAVMASPNTEQTPLTRS